MSYEKKEVPDAKVSLKYIAWNVKEISENFKILVDEVKKMNGNQDPRNDPSLMKGNATNEMDQNDDIPF